MQIIDQTAWSVQSDLGLHCPQKILVSSTVKNEFMPFSTFQLYHVGQCTYPCFPGVIFNSTPHNILSKTLAASHMTIVKAMDCGERESILRKNICWAGDQSNDPSVFMKCTLMTEMMWFLNQARHLIWLFNSFVLVYRMNFFAMCFTLCFIKSDVTSGWRNCCV